MTLSMALVTGIVTLQSSAALAYAYQRQWKLAGVWLGVSIANFFMILLDRAK